MSAARPSITMLAVSAILFFGQVPGFAWGNRGHRTINLVAAQSFPSDMPAFMRTPQAELEISYLGPEPDRWTQRGLEPELASTTVPDHYFVLELAKAVSPLPRKRYDFLKKLNELQQQHPDDIVDLTPQQIGTLPWKAEELFEQLNSAFRTYRMAMGQYPPSEYSLDAQSWGPITKGDLPDIEASILFYAGWLGHYIGDGCQPLHTPVNLHGWMVIDKQNPLASPGTSNAHTTTISIHHEFEVMADDAIQQGAVTPAAIRSLVRPVRQLNDPFVDTIAYLQNENRFVEALYRIDKNGQATARSPEAQRFIEARMAEGSVMLRDLIYTAWIRSAGLIPAKHEPDTDILNR